MLWFAHLKPDDQIKFKELLRNNYKNPCFVRLKEVVENKRKSLENSERNVDIYASPNWAYLQAHNNGARQMLRFIEDMLKFVE